MIYGIVFGITIIVTAFTYKLIPFYFVFLGGIACIVIVAIGKTQRAKKASATAPTTAGTTPATTTATAASPAPPPPASVAAARSYAWLWSFLTVFFGGLIALTIYHKILVPGLNFPGPSPRAVAPSTAPPATKKELQQHVVKRPLEVRYRDGKQTILRAEGVPWMETARYRVVFRLTHSKPGKLFIELNGGKGGDGPFHFDSYITGEEVTVVFFEPTEGGLQGDPKYFVPGTNWVKFYSPDGGEIKIRYAQIVVEYWT